MLCSYCREHEAVIDRFLGVLPCETCRKRHISLQSPNDPIEFTSESIKEQRKAYRKDTLPMHNRGELDKGWVERFGEKKAKERGFTSQEIKKAKYVWAGTDEYYKSDI